MCLSSLNRPSLRSILNRTQLLILLSIILIGGSAISFISFYSLDRYSSKNSLLIADTVRHRVDAALVFHDVEEIQEAILQISQGQEVNKIQVLDQNEQLLAQVDLRANQPESWFEQLLFKNAKPVSVDITHHDTVVGWVRVYGSSKSMLSFAAQVFAVMIATLLLILAGVVSVESLVDKRRYIIVGCFAVSAIVTPPDGLSMLMLAIPMWLLFELGLLMGRFLEPKPVDLTAHEGD